MALLIKEVPPHIYEKENDIIKYCSFDVGNRHVVLGTTVNSVSFHDSETMDVVASTTIQNEGKIVYLSLSPEEGNLLVINEHNILTIFSLPEKLVNLHRKELKPDYRINLGSNPQSSKYNPVIKWLNDKNVLVAVPSGNVYLLSNSLALFQQRRDRRSGQMSPLHQSYSELQGMPSGKDSVKASIKSAFSKYKAKILARDGSGTGDKSWKNENSYGNEKNCLWLNTSIFDKKMITSKGEEETQGGLQTSTKSNFQEGNKIIQIDGQIKEIEEWASGEILFTVSSVISTRSSAFYVEFVGSVSRIGESGPSLETESMILTTTSQKGVTKMGNTIIVVGSRPKKVEGPEIGSCMSTVHLRDGGHNIIYSGRNRLRIFAFDPVERRVISTFQHKGGTIPLKELGLLYCFAHGDMDIILCFCSENHELGIVTIATKEKKVAYSHCDTPEMIDELKVSSTGILIFKAGTRYYFGKLNFDKWGGESKKMVVDQNEENLAVSKVSSSFQVSEKEDKAIAVDRSSISMESNKIQDEPNQKITDPPDLMVSNNETAQSKNKINDESVVPAPFEEKTKEIEPQVSTQKLFSENIQQKTPIIKQDVPKSVPVSPLTNSSIDSMRASQSQSVKRQQAKQFTAKISSKLKQVTHKVADKMKVEIPRLNVGKADNVIPVITQCPLVHRFFLDIPEVVYKEKSLLELSSESNNLELEPTSLLASAPLLAFLPGSNIDPARIETQKKLDNMLRLLENSPEEIQMTPLCQLISLFCDNIMKVPKLLSRSSEDCINIQRTPLELNNLDFLRHENIFRKATSLITYMFKKTGHNDPLIALAKAKISNASIMITLRTLSPILTLTTTSEGVYNINVMRLFNISISYSVIKEDIQDKLCKELLSIINFTDPSVVIPIIASSGSQKLLRFIEESFHSRELLDVFTDEMLENLINHRVTRSEKRKLLKRAYEDRSKVGFGTADISNLIKMFSIPGPKVILENDDVNEEFDNNTQALTYDYDSDEFFMFLSSLPGDYVHILLEKIIETLVTYTWNTVDTSSATKNIYRKLLAYGKRLNKMGISLSEVASLYNDPVKVNEYEHESKERTVSRLCIIAGIDSNVEIQVRSHFSEISPYINNNSMENTKGYLTNPNSPRGFLSSPKSDFGSQPVLGFDELISAEDTHTDDSEIRSIVLFGPINTIKKELDDNDRLKSLKVLKSCLIYQDKITNMLEEDKYDLRKEKQSVVEILVRIMAKEKENGGRI